MIRVCFTFGTWQLLTLIASLLQSGQEQQDSGEAAAEEYEDYLVVYETGGVPEAFKQTLHRMAEIAWPWKRIVWAYDLLTDKRRFSQRQFTRVCRALTERIGVSPEQVGEVWVCWLTRPAEKIVFETYSKARIVVYEDGLISYLPLTIAPDMTADSRSAASGLPLFRSLALRLQEIGEAIQPVWRFRRSRWNLDPRHLDRVRGVYFLLSRNAPRPEALAYAPNYFVDYAKLRDALYRASPSLPDSALWAGDTAAEETPPRLLLLGQALSRNGIMERSEELRFYESVIEAVAAKGYQILWKEHPRVSEPFFEDLKAFVRSKNRGEVLEAFPLPYAFPVELAAPRLNVAGCVAGTSAALFYLQQLYDIPTYTFAGELLSRMQGADIFMNNLVRNEIPPLSALPPASALRTGKA